MTSHEVLRDLPLAEEILESNRHRAHGDDAGYDAHRAHVYRVVNFARALTPSAPDSDDKLAVAVGRRVGACAVEEREVEEDGVTLAQRDLNVVFGEVLDELGAVERDVPAEELLRVRQQHRRAALQRQPDRSSAPCRVNAADSAWTTAG